MTASNIPTQEQTGVSAQKAIEFMSPILARVIKEQKVEGAQKAFAKDLKTELEALPQDELMVLGHRLDSLQTVTELMLTVVGVIALAGLTKNQPVDPSLS